MRILAAIVASIFLTSGSFAQDKGIEILSHKEEIFVNKNCRKTKTCDLKKVEYFVEDYKVGIGDDFNFGTRFFVRYETKSVKNLEKYVFMQFIRGCDFSSRLIDGQVEIDYDARYPRGKGEVFRFSNWIIDTYDSNLIYSAYPGKSKFFGYRWNTVPGSFAIDTEKVYGEHKTRTPRLYIVDHPGSAFYSNGIAHNISLQFKTCIYRAREVPLVVPFYKTNFAKPLSCYEWSSSFVYDHFTEEFKTPTEIVPACKQ